MKKMFAILIIGVVVSLSLPFPCLAGGHLKIALTGNLNTLDPAKAKSGDEYLYMFLVFNGLTVIDRNMNLQPDLAHKWESSKDLKTWTFYLRKGVKFHHGREMTAEDVAFTIERIMDKATGSKARVNFLIVKKIDIVDKYTISFHLNTPYAGFPDIFGGRQVRIIPKDAAGDLSTKPIGTGPFQFKSFMPGDKVELVKNPNFFEKGKPKLDAVTLIVMPESASRITALETGEIHVVWKLPMESVDRLKKNTDITVDEVSTSSWDGIIMNSSKKPFDDLRVRKAIALAIDKEQMAEIVLFGHGSPTHSPIPPAHPFFNKNLSFKTDLKKAKQLLNEAGYANGFEITLIAPEGRPVRERLAVTTREFLKPLGIRVNIQNLPWDKFLADAEGKAAFYVDGFFSRPTVDTSIYPWYHSTGSWNKGLWHYKNSEIDAVLDDARQTPGLEDQKKAYMHFQKLVVEDDPPSVIPYNVNHIDGYRKEVKNLHSSPMMWFDLREVEITD
jgi:peptide/nickel transport system substrate-binding protein